MAVIINGGINIGSGRTLITSQPFIPIDINFACVSGAGTPEVNGTYIRINDNRYESSNYQINGIRLSNDLGPWAIRTGGGGDPVFYIGNTTPTPQYPWQETSWAALDGELPVPTVSQGQC